MALPFRHCSSSRLDEIVHHGVLCAFDFDGTLAPPAAHAEKVRVPLGTVLRSFELSTYAPVAVITERASASVCAYMEFEPDFVVDSHEPPGAVARLMEESGAHSLIYVGNQVSDEELLRFDRRQVLSVRIGHAHNSAAEFFLPHRLDVFQLLDELIRRLRQASARNWMRGAARPVPDPGR